MVRWFAVMPFRRLVVALLGFEIMMGLVIALVGVTEHPANPDIVWQLALGIPAAVVVIGSPVVLLVLRPWLFRRDINEMLTGAAWAHWQYDQREWKAATYVEHQRERKSSFGQPVAAGAVGAFVAVIGLAMQSDFGSTLAFTGFAMIGTGLVIIAATLVTNAATVARLGRRGDIYVSKLAVYRKPGGYLPLTGPDYVLCDVRFIDAARPPIVRFEARVRRRGGDVAVEPWVDVMVPTGRDDEGRALVERFKTELLPRPGDPAAGAR